MTHFRFALLIVLALLTAQSSMTALALADAPEPRFLVLAGKIPAGYDVTVELDYFSGRRSIFCDRLDSSHFPFWRWAMGLRVQTAQATITGDHYKLKLDKLDRTHKYCRWWLGYLKLNVITAAGDTQTFIFSRSNDTAVPSAILRRISCRGSECQLYGGSGPIPDQIEAVALGGSIYLPNLDVVAESN